MAATVFLQTDGWKRVPVPSQRRGEFTAAAKISSIVQPCFTVLLPLQEDMSNWIQAILNASAERSDGQGSNPGTPVSGRAQTLPAAVTLTTESSPGKREKDKEKEKEKRFSLFSKKKQ